MTATLTPAEAAEVTRFGIHDKEAFEGIIARADDVLTCAITGCDDGAEWSVSARCHPAPALFLCTPHYQRGREIRAAEWRGMATARCLECGHIFHNPTFDTVYLVVKL